MMRRRLSKVYLTLLICTAHIASFPGSPCWSLGTRLQLVHVYINLESKEGPHKAEFEPNLMFIALGIVLNRMLTI